MRINRKLYKEYYDSTEFREWIMYNGDNFNFFSFTPAKTWEEIYINGISLNKLTNWHKSIYEVHHNDFELYHQTATIFCLMKKQFISNN
jgi:hypothetical protein